MAQDGNTAGGNSYTIDNVSFPVGRTKLNSIFSAIRSTNIGSSAPDLVAGQFWIDNTTPSATVWTMYFYDGTDSIQFATVDTTANTINFIDSTVIADIVTDTTPQLGGTLDANGNDIDMGTNLITDTKVGQWDSAYGWGDHSTQGYLTSETDSQTLSFTSPNLSISNGNSVDLSALDTGILNVSEDLTPQLGGDLDLNSSDITGTGNVNITGSVTATSFSGDGSALTGLPSGDVVDDTTPQLGGDLDLNSNNITGTGAVNITGNVTATAYFGDGSSLTGISADATTIKDADNDTKIQAEESADEDKLRFDTAGTERAVMDSNGLFFTTNGGFVAHHNDIANDISLTNQNMMLAGSVTISGTLTIGTGSTVVII